MGRDGRLTGTNRLPVLKPASLEPELVPFGHFQNRLVPEPLLRFWTITGDLLVWPDLIVFVFIFYFF